MSRVQPLLTNAATGITGPWVEIPRSGVYYAGRCTAYVTSTFGTTATTVTIQQSHNGSAIFPTVLLDGTTAAVYSIANVGAANGIMELEPHATHYRAVTASGDCTGISCNLVF